MIDEFFDYQSFNFSSYEKTHTLITHGMRFCF